MNMLGMKITMLLSDEGAEEFFHAPEANFNFTEGARMFVEPIMGKHYRLSTIYIMAVTKHDIKWSALTMVIVIAMMLMAMLMAMMVMVMVIVMAVMVMVTDTEHAILARQRHSGQSAAKRPCCAALGQKIAQQFYGEKFHPWHAKDVWEWW